MGRSCGARISLLSVPSAGDFLSLFFFFQAEDGIRDKLVTGVQTCALPISIHSRVIIASRSSVDDSCHSNVRLTSAMRHGGMILRVIRSRTCSRAERDGARSEERRVGKECRSRWSADHEEKKQQKSLA